MAYVKTRSTGREFFLEHEAFNNSSIKHKLWLDHIPVSHFNTPETFVGLTDV